MPDPVEIPRALSITHEHLFACLNTLIREKLAKQGEPGDAPLRILDAGCGDGQLLAYVFACLRSLHPSLRVELHGFDVIDHGVQPKEFMQKTVTMLSDRFPDVDWSDRVTAITAKAPWPFPDGYFDIVLSNQVLEHVHEPERFMAEQFRVLARGGAGFHLFPLKHYVYEGHLLLPWVHRIRSWDFMRAYIELLSRLGLGKYPEHRRTTGVSPREFATRHADYMFFWTRYMTERQAVEVARAAGFRACYRFTTEFYTGKLRSIFRKRRHTHYASDGRALKDAWAVKFLRYASCVTLTLEKQNAY